MDGFVENGKIKRPARYEMNTKTVRYSAVKETMKII